MRITGLYSLISYVAPKASAAERTDGVQSSITLPIDEAYEWTPDKQFLIVKAPVLRTIVRRNIKGLNLQASEYKLLDMEWKMLAKAIARDYYGKETDEATAATLATMLMGANGYRTPAQVLEKERPLVKGEGVASLMEKGSYSSFAVLEVYKDSKGQLGSFPYKLSIRIPKRFIDAVNALPALAAEKPNSAPVAADVPAPKAEPKPEPSARVLPAAAPQAVREQTQNKYWKVQVAVYAHGAMAKAEKLSQRLDQLLKDYPHLSKNEILDTCVQENGDGLLRVQAGAFIYKEHAEGMRDYLIKRFKGDPELQELGEPIIKYED
jgi:hypothetical protein